MLEVHGADVVRKDFCSEAWTGAAGVGPRLVEIAHARVGREENQAGPK